MIWPMVEVLAAVTTFIAPTYVLMVWILVYLDQRPKEQA